MYYGVRDKAQFEGKRLLIVGGGDSAVDWALHLYPIAREVVLIHRRDEFRAHEQSVAQLRQSPVRILTPYELRRGRQRQAGTRRYLPQQNAGRSRAARGRRNSQSGLCGEPVTHQNLGLECGGQRHQSRPPDAHEPAGRLRGG